MVRRIAIAAMLAAAPAIAQQPQLAPGEALIQVSGTGKVLAVPDTAAVETGVLSDGATPERALAGNAAIAERLIAALRASGVPDTAIRTTAVRLAPRYRADKDGDATDQVIGFRATNQLKVYAASAARAGDVIDALARAGATEIDGPDLGFADEKPLLARARAAAVTQAERQARDYAASLGLKGLRVLRVSERSAAFDGVSDVIVTGSRKRTPVEPGEQEVSVTVWIDYAANR